MPDNYLPQILATPWKLKNEIFRFLLLPWIRLQFALSGIRWGKGWRIYGTPILQICRGSKLEIGSSLELRSHATSNPLAPNHPAAISTRTAEAKITIGDNFGMTGGSITAEENITIGSRVLVGANSIIIDTDFHPLDPSSRKNGGRQGKTAPVVIEDDVFIGTQTIILKGSRIGRGAVIGAGSVVAGNIPPNAIVAGNPARVVKSFD